MTALTIKNFNHKILVVGSIYDKINKLEDIKKIEHNYNLIIIAGNILYPFKKAEELEFRIKLFNNSKYHYVIGSYDLKVLSSNLSTTINNWIISQPNAIIVEFINQTRLIVINGGITPQINKTNFNDSLEISFVSNIEKKPWHQFYGGGFGYIISNNPLTNEKPVFYNYSAQIGNIYENVLNTYAQEIDQYGLKKTILI
jgi:hypothetical protein